MERRGFLGRLLAGAAAAPVLTLAKRSVGSPITLARTDTINTKLTQSLNTDGPLVVYDPSATPLLEAVKQSKPGHGFHDWYVPHTNPFLALKDAREAEHLDIGTALGMETREVVNARYEWLLGEKSGGACLREFNYLQIVRTPVTVDGRDMTDPGWIGGRREAALHRHLDTIEDLFQYGKRARLMDREDGFTAPTTTGGREFFGTAALGRVAYYRGRGLVWRTWQREDTDAIHGEWLSDIGWCP